MEHFGITYRLPELLMYLVRATTSFIYIKNSSVPSTVPCGTAAHTRTHCDDSSPTITRCWRFARKLVTQVCNLPRIPYDYIHIYIYIYTYVVYTDYIYIYNNIKIYIYIYIYIYNNIYIYYLLYIYIEHRVAHGSGRSVGRVRSGQVQSGLVTVFTMIG